MWLSGRSHETLVKPYIRHEPCKAAERRAGRVVHVEPGGGSGNPRVHEFGWRDAMDVVVKWRQLSEPNDQVLQVLLL